MGNAAQSNLAETFHRFRDERSLEARNAIAEDICYAFDENTLTEKEILLAREIIEVLSQDVELRIRKTLATILQYNDMIPHTAALRLANDEDAVALPILQHCPILTEGDLQQIVESSERAERLTAVARRKGLSANVAVSIVRKGLEAPVSALIQNDTAERSALLDMEIGEQFEKNPSILQQLISRGGLDVRVAEKIVAHVSGEWKKQLVEKYGVSSERADQVMQMVQEKEVLDLLPQDECSREARMLAEHLFEQKKLNHSLILRALCRADRVFFQKGLSLIAGISEENTAKLVQRSDVKGLEPLLRTAKMPDSMIGATIALIRLMNEYPRLSGESAASYAKRIIECIAADEDVRNQTNMSYFMALLGSTASSVPAPLV